VLQGCSRKVVINVGVDYLHVAKSLEQDPFGESSSRTNGQAVSPGHCFVFALTCSQSLGYMLEDFLCLSLR
jgi:hypothetical protein